MLAQAAEVFDLTGVTGVVVDDAGELDEFGRRLFAPLTPSNNLRVPDGGLDRDRFFSTTRHLALQRFLARASCLWF